MNAFGNLQVGRTQNGGFLFRVANGDKLLSTITSEEEAKHLVNYLLKELFPALAQEPKPEENTQ